MCGSTDNGALAFKEQWMHGGAYLAGVRTIGALAQGRRLITSVCDTFIAGLSLDHHTNQLAS
jgi:hypothetical protein